MPQVSDKPPRFSLVIPAYNEQDYLPRLLDSVDRARARYSGGEDAIEVIVADNCSTDATAQLARERGCRVVRQERRIIAAVRNAGARAARGDIVCFNDADGMIHPESFNAVEAALATGRVVGGATGIKLDRMSIGIAAAYCFMMPLVLVLGMDTGLVFCRRVDFEAVGGYNEKLRFAEDVRFLLDLKSLGRSRGQKLVRLRRFKGVTSTRKFDKFGDWHYPTMIMRVAFSIVFGRKGAAHRLAESYWYGAQRERGAGDSRDGAV